MSNKYRAFAAVCAAVLLPLQAALPRLGLDGDSWVRIEAAHKQDQQQQQQQHAVCEAPIRAILQVWLRI